LFFDKITLTLALTCRNEKGSCSVPLQSEDDINETRQCQLCVEYGQGRTLVAYGKVFEATTFVHGMQLSDTIIKVTVEEVLMGGSLVLVPTDKIYIMAHLSTHDFDAWRFDEDIA